MDSTPQFFSAMEGATRDNLKNENKTSVHSCEIWHSNEPLPQINMQNNEKSNVRDEDIENDGHGAVDHPTSYIETLMHILRGNIGPGVFAMGNAFQNAGILVAPVVMFILAVICLHCQHILLSLSTNMKIQAGLKNYPGFARTVELCFQTSHPTLKKLAPTMRKLVNVFLCVTQLGFNCVHFVFISTSIQQVMDYYDIRMTIHLHMVIILIPIWLTCMVRNLKYLAPLSTFANAVMLVGIAITFYFLIIDMPPIEDRPYVADWTKFPLFFGTALYAFEGIGLVLPLHREMKHPERFSKPLGVLNVGTSFVIMLLISIGFLSYLKYGDEIEGSITVNLPIENILSQVVKIMIALAVLCTYALQFYIPVGIMWPQVLKYLGPFRRPVLMELGFRTLLVLITFTLAEVIPYLGLFISLVGAISSTALALLFPPVLDLAYRWKFSKLPPYTIIKNALIIFIGSVGCITGSYESIYAIVDTITKPDVPGEPDIY